MTKLRILAFAAISALATAAAVPAMATGCEPGPTKGNNGWGNGDQSAPGSSGDHNKAENDAAGGSHDKHGPANPN
ncbi:hypothetical protein [Ostreiculturibacter nitratireducens]|uniref:hypothetical protein n=1 Tax=Ostreiculturibacter nitratireducens TaxID=3075226 RepID=UPI0031B6028D